MNSLQILHALRDIKNHTVGVYPADRIPKVWAKPTAFVVNTDGHKQPGTHWVAMYVNRDGHGCYFDSYGLPPVIPQHLQRLRRNCKFFRYSAKQLQGPESQLCGHYCVMFLHFMSTGLGIHRFRSAFSNDLSKNDKIVYDYYNEYINNRNRSKPRDKVFNTGAAIGGGHRDNSHKTFSNKSLCCVQGCCSRTR